MKFIPVFGSTIDTLLSKPGDNLKDEIHRKAIDTLFDYLNEVAKRLTELDSNQTINSSHLKQAITEVDKAEFEKLSSVIKKIDESNYSKSIVRIFKDVEQINYNKAKLFSEFMFD